MLRPVACALFLCTGADLPQSGCRAALRTSATGWMLMAGTGNQRQCVPAGRPINQRMVDESDAAWTWTDRLYRGTGAWRASSRSVGIDQPELTARRGSHSRPTASDRAVHHIMEVESKARQREVQVQHRVPRHFWRCTVHGRNLPVAVAHGQGSLQASSFTNVDGQRGVFKYRG